MLRGSEQAPVVQARAQVSATLTIDTTYIEARHVMHQTETLIVPEESLAKVGQSKLVFDPKLRKQLTVKRLTGALTRALTSTGWNTDGSGSLHVKATRSPPDLKVQIPKVLPAGRTNTLDVRPPVVPPLLVRGKSVPFDLELADGSELALKVPKGMVGESEPAGERQDQVLGGNQTLVFPLTSDTRSVQYEARGSLYREEPLNWVADATLWTPFKVLLALLIAAISDEVRKAITRYLPWTGDDEDA